MRHVDDRGSEQIIVRVLGWRPTYSEPTQLRNLPRSFICQTYPLSTSLDVSQQPRPWTHSGE